MIQLYLKNLKVIYTYLYYIYIYIYIQYIYHKYQKNLPTNPYINYFKNYLIFLC
jgi:hypothetical protein